MALVALLMLAACGTPRTDGTARNAVDNSGNAGGAAGDIARGYASGGLPNLPRKDKYRVGFSQTESSNLWRVAQTASLRAEAARLGHELVYTDAAGNTAKQVSDVEAMIVQKVDIIFLSPREEKPLAAAVKKAREANIPVILLDRNVDQSIAKASEDYVTFIGSDFIQQGQRAAGWLIDATGGNAKIIELEGTTGSSPARDRKKGFHDALEGQSGMQVVASQTGDFRRDLGRQVTESLLQAHPDVTAVFAHNDEMAIGAIAALEAAGKQPGKDVIIVSIDGSREAIQLIIDGKLGATVECNPRFGPKAFEMLLKYANGEQIPERIIIPDKFFDARNARAEIANAY